MADIIDITTRRAERTTCPTPSHPDGEFIWRCDQLVGIMEAINDAHETLKGRELKRAIQPLDRLWFDVTDQLAALPIPYTPEGVRAAARFMIFYDDVNDPRKASWRTPLWAAMCRACARYLVAPTQLRAPDIGPPR